MYGQMISSISSDNVDTDEIFMMALTFFSMLSILDEVCKKKIFTIRADPGRYPVSSFHPFWSGPQGEETFLKRYRLRRVDYHRMVLAIGLSGQILLCGRPGREQVYSAEFCLLDCQVGD